MKRITVTHINNATTFIEADDILVGDKEIIIHDDYDEIHILLSNTLKYTITNTVM